MILSSNGTRIFARSTTIQSLYLSIDILFLFFFNSLHVCLCLCLIFIKKYLNLIFRLRYFCFHLYLWCNCWQNETERAAIALTYNEHRIFVFCWWIVLSKMFCEIFKWTLHIRSQLLGFFFYCFVYMNSDFGCVLFTSSKECLCVFVISFNSYCCHLFRFRYIYLRVHSYVSSVCFFCKSFLFCKFHKYIFLLFA